MFRGKKGWTFKATNDIDKDILTRALGFWCNYDYEHVYTKVAYSRKGVIKWAQWWSSYLQIPLIICEYPNSKYGWAYDDDNQIIRPKKEVFKRFDYDSFIDNYNLCTDKNFKDLVDKLYFEEYYIKIYKQDSCDGYYCIATSRADYKGKKDLEIGLKIGFSEFNNSFMGYEEGRLNILFDRVCDFDKWSKCRKISKEICFDNIYRELFRIII